MLNTQHMTRLWKEISLGTILTQVSLNLKITPSSKHIPKQGSNPKPHP